MGRIEISIILPVYNETARLVSGLTPIVEYLESQKKSYEIIMIDDGSNVPAAEVINHSHLKKTIFQLIKQQKFQGFRLRINQGKGKAIAIGVHHAQGEVIAFMDIDGSVPIETLPTFLTALKAADLAIGSRRIPDSVIAVHQPWLRETGGRIYTFLSQQLFGLMVHDTTCGFKAFRKEVAKHLFSQLKIARWAFDTELLALATKQDYKIKEVPVVWSNKTGSKVKLKDTLESFIDLLKIFFYHITTHNSSLTTHNSLCDSCEHNAFKFLFDHHQNWKVQQCTYCGLVQVIPRPTRKEVAALYHEDEGHFDPYIEQEEVHRKYFHTKLSAISLQPTAKLLDVGCLTGVLIDEAGKMGLNAEGLDISKDAVMYCRKRGLTAHHGTLDIFIKKNPKKKYDVVTALEIIEHEYSPRALVTSMYKALNTDGVAVVSTPNHGSWWRKVMGKRWPGYTHKEHLYFFDPKSLERLFRSVGFTEVTITSGDSRPFPLWFLFKRGADYFPEFAPVLKVIAALLKPFPILNPINPWDDLLVIAKK